MDDAWSWPAYFSQPEQGGLAPPVSLQEQLIELSPDVFCSENSEIQVIDCTPGRFSASDLLAMIITNRPIL